MEKNDAFFEAIKTGDSAQVEQLVAQDATLVNARTDNQLSAVLLATYYGQPAIATLLIERGADLTYFEAAATGQLARVQAYLDAQPELLNAFSPDGFQALGLAAFFGHEAVARFLLDRGAEVNTASRNGQQVMPLHSAVASQQLEIARWLIERGADVNARQADDFTPLQGAANNGQMAMVELLLAHDADKTARSTNGKTAADIAEAQGHIALLPLLRLA
jgi:uncharacterized protein